MATNKGKPKKLKGSTGTLTDKQITARRKNKTDVQGAAQQAAKGKKK